MGKLNLVGWQLYKKETIINVFEKAGFGLKMYGSNNKNIQIPNEQIEEVYEDNNGMKLKILMTYIIID